MDFTGKTDPRPLQDDVPEDRFGRMLKEILHHTQEPYAPTADTKHKALLEIERKRKLCTTTWQNRLYKKYGKTPQADLKANLLWTNGFAGKPKDQQKNELLELYKQPRDKILISQRSVLSFAPSNGLKWSRLAQKPPYKTVLPMTQGLQHLGSILKTLRVSESRTLTEEQWRSCNTPCIAIDCVIENNIGTKKIPVMAYYSPTLDTLDLSQVMFTPSSAVIPVSHFGIARGRGVRLIIDMLPATPLTQFSGSISEEAKEQYESERFKQGKRPKHVGNLEERKDVMRNAYTLDAQYMNRDFAINPLTFYDKGGVNRQVKKEFGAMINEPSSPLTTKELRVKPLPGTSAETLMKNAVDSNGEPKPRDTVSIEHIGRDDTGKLYAMIKGGRILTRKVSAEHEQRVMKKRKETIETAKWAGGPEPKKFKTNMDPTELDLQQVYAANANWEDSRTPLVGFYTLLDSTSDRGGDAPRSWTRVLGYSRRHNTWSANVGPFHADVLASAKELAGLCDKIIMARFRDFNEVDFNAKLSKNLAKGDILHLAPITGKKQGAPIGLERYIIVLTSPTAMDVKMQTRTVRFEDVVTIRMFLTRSAEWSIPDFQYAARLPTLEDSLLIPGKMVPFPWIVLSPFQGGAKEDELVDAGSEILVLYTSDSSKGAAYAHGCGAVQLKKVHPPFQQGLIMAPPRAHSKHT